jgi:hypothetical protein
MKKKKKDSEGSNTTKSGEFICSYNQWLPIEKQKEQANKMNDMTK